MAENTGGRTASTVAGLISGVGLGLLIGIITAGVLGYVFVKKKAVEVRKGWNLAPVVVALVDIPEGTAVTFDMIAQRNVPEQFVTSSVVKPESANYIVNKALLVPVRSGDMLLWSQFSTGSADDLNTCLRQAQEAREAEHKQKPLDAKQAP